MNQIKIAPSILSADFSIMGETIKKLQACGADVIHCDVMDGSFVDPITFGGQMVKNIRPLTTLTLDCHLMIEHPQTQIKFFAEAGADIITVHYEACVKMGESYLKETLEMIHSYGVKAGVVVNPNTDVSAIFDVVPMCDMILVMSVFPGYGGQKFIPTALEQVAKLRAYCQSVGKGDMDIEIDGGVTLDNVSAIKQAGANVLVAGSTVFKAPDMAQVIADLKNA